MFFLILEVLLLLLLCFVVYMAKRNHAVCLYRLRYLRNIRLGQSEKAFQEQIDIYNSVSYEQMYYQFWRPLDSFYPRTQ